MISPFLNMYSNPLQNLPLFLAIHEKVKLVRLDLLNIIKHVRKYHEKIQIQWNQFILENEIPFSFSGK